MSNEWRSLVTEAIIDPELAIIDPHHHLWPGLEYYQEGPYLLDDIRRDVESGHNIIATVYVDAHANYRETGAEEFRPVGETAFANRTADEAEALGLHTKVCAGIVSNINLHLSNVADVLDAHISAAPERLRGVRQIACWRPDDEEGFRIRPEYFEDPAFRRGFKELAPRGLTFDTCIYHFQLPQIIRLAREFPETTIILDHIGTPLGTGPYTGRLDEAIAEWRPLLAEIAKCPNVVVKLGGQGMFIAGYDFHEQKMPPTSDQYNAKIGDLLLYTIDQFGPRRGMFESNFPVDGLSSSYAILWNAFKKLASGFTPSERSELFAGTAARIYRLEQLL